MYRADCRCPGLDRRNHPTMSASSSNMRCKHAIQGRERINRLFAIDDFVQLERVAGLNKRSVFDRVAPAALFTRDVLAVGYFGQHEIERVGAAIGNRERINHDVFIARPACVGDVVAFIQRNRVGAVDCDIGVDSAPPAAGSNHTAVKRSSATSGRRDLAGNCDRGARQRFTAVKRVDGAISIEVFVGITDTVLIQIPAGKATRTGSAGCTGCTSSTVVAITTRNQKSASRQQQQAHRFW